MLMPVLTDLCVLNNKMKTDLYSLNNIINLTFVFNKIRYLKPLIEKTN